jgi:hypothetical protein
MMKRAGQALHLASHLVRGIPMDSAADIELHK